MKKIVFLLFTVFLFADEHLILSNFKNLKEFYYNHQIVHLELKTISAQNGKLIVKSNYPVDINTTTDDNVSYISNISFELNNSFPEFNILLENNNSLNEDEINLTINSQIRNLIPPSDFCGVLAKDLNVTHSELSSYNDEYNLLYFDILFKDANNRDFVFAQKVDSILKDKSGSNLFYSYSAIVPKNQNNFVIVYFNTIKNRYEKISFNAHLNNEKVSTQVDLNPVNKTKIYIINGILLGLILLWLLLYYYRRKVIYIILIVMTLISLVFLNLPKAEIIINNKEVHILPFNNSTVFMVIDTPQKVKVLNEKNGYKQIEFNNKIGWIKNDK